VAMKRADEPHGEARDEFSIFADLAGRLGFRDSFTLSRSAGEWLRLLYEEWRGPLGLPGFEDFWAAGEVALPGRREDAVLFADFRAGRRLDTPSGRIELHSGTVESFGYGECPGEPVYHEQPLSPYKIVLICNQPASRLHSQLDMGGVSGQSKVQRREPLRLHPADAAARGIADGDVARVFNERGSLLAGVTLSEDCAPGVAQLSTGAWFDPSAPEVATCVHGNPNVLTADVGTSRLSQGCTGQHARVEIALHTGVLPPVLAYEPPLELS
jgi:biotin/methionine sulfoxide reductase